MIRGSTLLDDVGELANNLSKALVEDQQSRGLTGPLYDGVLEHDDLDNGTQQCYYCLQLDVVLSDVLGRPPPPSHAWTPAVICDMII